MRKIIIARHAGVCFGVKKALETVKEYTDSSRKVYTLGPLIHNRQVVEELNKRGIGIIETLEQIEEGIVIIRSHGVAPEIYEKAKEREFILVDATCPFVKKIQDKVKEYYNKGYQIIIVGDGEHPEVKGVNGWCNYSAIIVNSVSEAERVGYYDRLCVVAQTTITLMLWEEVKKVLENKGGEVKFFNTICNATHLRQQAAIEVAKQADIMVVIGGFHSSNTRKLYKLCKAICDETYHIETADGLPVDKIKNAEIIGVTAGASTPDWIIKEVVDKMSNLENTNLEPKNEQGAEERETMDAFEDTVVSVRPGTIVKGKVIQVGDDGVIVNIGYKSDAIIPKDELTADPTLTPSDVVKVGDEIEALVKKVDDGEGNVLLSKKKVDIEKGWEDLKEKFDEGEPVEAKVTEEVKGGLIGIVEGIRGFIPASHIDIGYVEDLQQFINKVLPVKIIELDRRKNKLILSRKVLMEEEKETKKKELLNSIKVGDRIKGEVKRLTDFGAFVDIGGIDGLIHISEMSWNRIDHPSEVLQVGQEVEVEVLAVDPERERVSLGYKQTQPHPWDNILEKYEKGQIVEGKVVRLADFGAFVELEPGVEGLVHVSQIAYHHVEKPQDELDEGQVVKVKILDIKPEERRISLSIKEAIERPKKEEKKSRAKQQPVHTDNEEPITTIGDLVGDILREKVDGE